MTPSDWYRSRIAEWTGRRDLAAARAVVLSRLRLVSFLGGVALLWWGTAHDHVVASTGGILSLVAFGALVIVHARVLEELDRAEVARRINGHGLARLARDWGALPEVPPPPEADVDAHPYARDLDVFGHASLTKWLGRPATTQGANRLWQWLLVPFGPDDIQNRQAAVDDLASKREWREALAIEGQLTVISQAELDRFLEWAESSERAAPAVMQAVAVLLPLTIWIPLALFLTGVTDGAWWLIPLVAGIAVSYGFTRRLHATFDRAELGERALQRYVTMLSLVCRERWTAPELVRLRTLLGVGGEAPALLGKLARIAGWSELVSFALDRWRARSGRHVRAWLDTLGFVDALATLSMIRADQPAWSAPSVDATLDALTATALGHPLLSDDRRVVNDVEVGPSGTILLITGSNMSGKSTLLRAIGLNTVLAQAGAPVCAAAFAMPPADLQTSIRVQDSLELGLSYFMAALARLKQIVDAAERGPAPERVLLYLLDEVLQGTNSVERGIAVRAVVRHLLDARAIGVMTTHDLGLADEEPLKSAARLAHFTEQVHPDGTMTFDYRLRSGLATSTNALRLMQLIGITPR